MLAWKSLKSSALLIEASEAIVGAPAGSAPDEAVPGLGRLEVGQRRTGGVARPAHEGRREKVDRAPGAVGRGAGIDRPVPVVQREIGIHLAQQRLEAVAQLAVPGDERRTAVDVSPAGVGVLVDVLLLVEVGHAVGIEALVVELEDRRDEAIAFLRGDVCDVAPDAVAKCHALPRDSSVSLPLTSARAAQLIRGGDDLDPEAAAASGTLVAWTDRSSR
jgi:hypothetical protein